MFFEEDYFSREEIIGIDEVGRGPLAGPVVAAAASFIGNQEELKEALKVLEELKVNDSKKLTEKRREKILNSLREDNLLAHQNLKLTNSKLNGIQIFIQEISEVRIDEINILNATFEAMEMATKGSMQTECPVLLIDGNKIPKNLDGENSHAIVKGDSQSLLIGLASVFAKQYRDDLMKELAEEYPGYGLEKHAGYPTKFHKEAISQLGVSPCHRKTFKGVKEYL